LRSWIFAFVVIGRCFNTVFASEAKSNRGACHRAALCADPLARNDDYFFTSGQRDSSSDWNA
jgi:hypothetical protein